MKRREFLLAASAALAAGTVRAADAQPPFSFYAMDTGLRGPDVLTLEAKVKLLKKLGYSGIGYTLNHGELPRLLELLDEHKLELSAVYLTPKLEDEVDPKLKESIGLLRGRPTRVELAVISKQHKPSSPDGDEAGAALLKKVSDLCGDTGPVVSVYPHISYWTERVEDGTRLARLVDRKNVGTHFNLVHWGWVKQSKKLEDLLAAALPHLFCVTINGLIERRMVALGQSDYEQKIVPLDEGDYDLAKFLALVKQVGYKGRVGLQAYSVPGPSEKHLERSMKKWRELMSKLG